MAETLSLESHAMWHMGEKTNQQFHVKVAVKLACLELQISFLEIGNCG